MGRIRSGGDGRVPARVGETAPASDSTPAPPAPGAETLRIPAAAVCHVRRGALWKLAQTSSRLAWVAETPGHTEHPEWYREVLAEFDAVRAVLNVIGWGDADTRASPVHIDAAQHRATLASIVSSIAGGERAPPTDQTARRELRKLLWALGGVVSAADTKGHGSSGAPFPLPGPQRPELRRRIDVLTVREREILVHLSDARRYAEIALLLCIDIETVRTHARRVRRKLGVQRSRELVGIYVPDPDRPP